MNQLPIITNCDGCGACCSYMGFPPFAFPPIVVSSDDDDQDYDWPDAIPPALLAEALAAGEVNPAGDGPCIWLDLETRRCRHYEHRPKACRNNFTPGDDDCRRVRAMTVAEGWTIDEKHDADNGD